MNVNRVWRRHFNLLVLATFFMGIGAHAQQLPPPPRVSRTVLVLGDSLSAEYGLTRGKGWVALLATKLQMTYGNDVRVVNASISGDTTAGGRARLPGLLGQEQPSLVVIELGGNDALRGLDLSTTQENLASMIQACRASHANVVLVGMQVPPNYGPDYNARFASVYAQLAKKYQTGLVPFFLKGIADAPNAEGLFQADRIHPKEEAHPHMLNNVWPEIKKRL